MTFPKSPRVVYEQDTLSQVVCAFNFPPILSIGSDTPTALQEALRVEYPLYEARPAAGQLQLAGAPPGLVELLAQFPLGQGQATLQHRFTTEDQSRSVVVGPRLLAVEDTHYVEWPSFYRSVASARAAVEEIYRPAFYARVGLRYQDVIKREMLKNDATWTDVIKPTFLGLLGAPELAAVKELAGSALIDLDRTGSLVRINHGLATDDQTGEVVYLIDADFYTEERCDGGEIDETLGCFNSEAGNLFRWAITAELHDALGRRDAH